jgi:hypothetical protein
MFDWAQHGLIRTHRYRGHHDAGHGSTTRCAYCNRIIRYCYALHDQNHKTFVIGACDFYRYKGTATFRGLLAAKTLMKAELAAQQRDLASYEKRNKEDGKCYPQTSM